MSAKMYSNEEIRRIVFDEDVKFIRLQFVDIFGTLKNVAITVEQLERALAGEIMFDGSSIEGLYRVEEADMYLRPDLSTFQIFPWRPHQGKVARLICDIVKADGQPFTGDPRYVLKKTVEKADAMGYRVKVGPEFEFFLFHTDENGDPTTTTHDKAGYFDLGPIDLGENVRRDIVLTLQDMDFKIAASHHEVAPGQHEIDFEMGDLLETVDNIVTFKLVVKVVAQKHGLHATFMPKPLHNINGSGMHTLMTLEHKDSGENVFYDAKETYNLSKDGHAFIGGLLKHAKGITAVTNPTINSYKRLVTGFEAPIRIGWSRSNNSPLVRIPAARGNRTSIEYRSPDPSCNPYLAIAAMVEAGLEGIRNNLKSDEPMSAQDLSEAVHTFDFENTLPKTLKDAVVEMDKDALVKNVLGDVYENYKRAKINEWTDYISIVHDWEVERYISRY
jgi:glutamine synthetase